MMKIFPSSQIRDIDAYTIKNEPIASVDLMERASQALRDWILNKNTSKLPLTIFVGPGNNGGDGLALARLISRKNIKVRVYILKLKELTGDPEINYKRLTNLGKVIISFIEKEDEFPEINKDEVIIDALFGSGLDRPLKGIPAALVKYINKHSNTKIAVDIPSGLFGEDNSNNNLDTIIKANYTLSFQFPKLSFLYPENDAYVGEWHILPIGLHKVYIESLNTNWHILQDNFVSKIIKPRKKFSHKGTYGHSLLIAGSYGKMGASILASEACLRTGVGLHTAHVPGKGCMVIQTALPEAMVSIDQSKEVFSSIPNLKPFNAIGIGPGIGLHKKTKEAFERLLNNIKTPMVIDADGLNILAKNKNLLKNLPKNSILTPHPKEFERIAGTTNNSYEQMQMQITLSKKYAVYIALKRAHTCISCPDGNIYFNTTGNPGIATAGSGDVLTGMILSFLAQGYQSKDAIILGVYLHGLAGDIAADLYSEEALIASDIINNIGEAYQTLKNQFHS